MINLGFFLSFFVNRAPGSKQEYKYAVKCLECCGQRVPNDSTGDSPWLQVPFLVSEGPAYVCCLLTIDKTSSSG